MEKLTNYTEYDRLTESERQEVDRRAAYYKDWVTIGGRSMETYMNSLKDHICAINNKLNEMDEKKQFKKITYEKVTTIDGGEPVRNFHFSERKNQNQSSEVEDLKTQMSSLKEDLAVIKQLLLNNK